jgi:hypothetical protein
MDFEVDWHNNKDGDITVFTDLCLGTVDSSKSRIKIAWLLEPPAVALYAYEYIKNNWNKFDYILTYVTDFLSIDKRFHYYPWGSKWINECDWGVHSKSKLVSIIASSKNFTPGHRLRHDSVKMFGNKMDVLGSGYKPIDNKILGLKEYHYSVVTENCKYNDYFTEKLLDCFLTGAVPIYYGFENYPKFFNPGGIISFERVEELNDIFLFIGLEDYTNRLKSIQENFEIAKKYAYMGVNVWNYFFEKFFQGKL